MDYNVRQRAFILNDDKSLTPIKAALMDRSDDKVSFGVNGKSIKVVHALVGVKDRKIVELVEATVFHVELDENGAAVCKYNDIPFSSLSWSALKELLKVLFKGKEFVSIFQRFAMYNPPLMRNMSWDEVDNIIPDTNDFGENKDFLSVVSKASIEQEKLFGYIDKGDRPTFDHAVSVSSLFKRELNLKHNISKEDLELLLKTENILKIKGQEKLLTPEHKACA
jgi:hypothetical protein